MLAVQGIAGITVDASNAKTPVTIRGGVDAGDLTAATGSRMALTGLARSSWAILPTGFEHNVTVPGNVEATVMIPAADVSAVGRPDPVILAQNGIHRDRRSHHRGEGARVDVGAASSRRLG